MCNIYFFSILRLALVLLPKPHLRQMADDLHHATLVCVRKVKSVNNEVKMYIKSDLNGFYKLKLRLEKKYFHHLSEFPVSNSLKGQFTQKSMLTLFDDQGSKFCILLWTPTIISQNQELQDIRRHFSGSWSICLLFGGDLITIRLQNAALTLSPAFFYSVFLPHWTCSRLCFHSLTPALLCFSEPRTEFKR